MRSWSSRLRNVTDHFDVVLIGIQNECRVIVRVVLGPQSRSSIIDSASSPGSGEKRVDLLMRAGAERDVHARALRIAFDQPEIASGIGALAKAVQYAETCRR